MDFPYDATFPKDVRELIENRVYRSKRRWFHRISVCVLIGMFIKSAGATLALIGYFYLNQDCLLYSGIVIFSLPWITCFLYAFILFLRLPARLHELRIQDIGFFRATYNCTREIPIFNDIDGQRIKY